MPGEKHPVLSFLAILVLFLGSGLLGIGLASWLAPDSKLASFIAFPVFPLAFMISMILWQGFSLIVLIFKLLVGALKKSKRGSPEDALQTLRKKAIIMIPVPVIFGGIAGALVGLLGGQGFFLALGVFTFTGFLQGLCMYLCAQKDLLPLIEDF